MIDALNLPSWMVPLAPALTVPTWMVPPASTLAAMQAAKRWLVHRSKVPSYIDGTPRRGQLDGPEDTARLASFEDAQRALQSGRFDGLGFALGDGWHGIDLDKITTENPHLQSLVPELQGYVERSPSGNGYHAIGFGEKFDSFKAGGAEAYAGGRFFTFTGGTVKDGPLTDLGPFVDQRIRPLAGSHGKATSKASNALKTTHAGPCTDEDWAQALDALKSLSADCTYDTWMSIGMSLSSTGNPAAFGAWADWSATAPNRCPSARELGAKFDSFKGGGIGLGTLFDLALKAGWERVRPPIDASSMFGPVPVANAGAETAPSASGMTQSLAEFTQELKPPVWLWSGVLEKGRVYALVAHPGAGKSTVSSRLALSVACGTDLQGRQVKRGRVLFMAGEDQYSTRLRFDLMLKTQGIDPRSIDIHFTTQAIALDGSALDHFLSTDHGQFDLVIVDTVAAHSSADDEDSNRSAHTLATALQRLSKGLGGACVLALAHPPKGVGRESLLPRGGSAFTGAIDGVICLWREAASSTVELFSHAGKYRGQQFSGVGFELATCTHSTLHDNFGRPAQTVIAHDSGAVDQQATEVDQQQQARDLRVNKRAAADQAVIDAIQKLADAGTFVTRGQARELCVIDRQGGEVRNVRRVVDRLMTDSQLVSMSVSRLLVQGGTKTCLFPARSNPHATQLAHALRLAQAGNCQDAEGLIRLIERLRELANGTVQPIHTLFSPVADTPAEFDG